MASAKESKITFLYGELNRLGHNGEYERAIKTANKILHDNPDEVKAFHCKIVSLIQLSKFQEGLNFITKNTKLSSGLIFEKAYCQYRLNQPQEALKSINNVAVLTPKLKELKSQILYRLERYEECLDVYRDVIKNSSDDYEDERETNLAAVVAHLSFSKSKAVPDLPQLREHTYELAYNRACRLLGEAKWSETENQLRHAERLCRETLEEDGASEEDLDEELAIIRIQMAYCLQAQGRGKEAQALYNSVLQSTRKQTQQRGEGEAPSGLDPSLVAVASNNLVAFNRDGNVFDSKKRMRVATAEGLEHRLTSRQRASIALNNCLLAFYTNQMDQCKQLCEKVVQDHPEMAVEASLVQASVLAREGKGEAGVALLRKCCSEEGNKDDGILLVLRLATAQLMLSEGKLSDACSLLLSLGDTTFKPGIVSALVALCLASGDRNGASNVLKRAVEWYRKNKAEGEDLRMLWRHAADFHLRGGDAAVAARSLEELLRLDPKDTKTMAQLVIAFSQFDPKKAQALSRKLPPVKGDSAVDVDALETSNWTMGSKAIRKTAAAAVGKDIPSPKATTPGVELLVKMPRAKRPRKGKLPKNYDPEATPDPERWLPRHERSGFRKKKDRRAKDVGKGTQGAASGASDLYDITKMQPTGGVALSSPSGRHASPGEGPRQQQRKGQQQKKKRKGQGSKW